MRQAVAMAITLPLPVRVAAGLVATGIQLVRSLPEEIPAIPVTLVGNAMKLSMKVQQEITTLATRGDELLGGFIGGRPQETATWATFDEDKEPTRPRPAATRPATRPAAEPAPGSGATPPSKAPRPARPWDRATTAQPPAAPAEAAVSAPPAAAPGKAADNGAAALHTPQATSLSDTGTTAIDAAAEVADAVVEAATHAVPDPAEAQTPDAPATSKSAAGAPSDTNDETDAAPSDTPDAPGTDEARGPAAPDPAAATSDADVDDGPAALPGYDRMTLAQVRGHLRELSAQDVATLLAYEQSCDNRAPFLTLLSNRLVTLGAQDS
jgi:hypothetical protein